MSEIYDRGNSGEIEPHAENPDISGEGGHAYDDMDEHLVYEEGVDTSDLQESEPPADRPDLDEADQPEIDLRTFESQAIARAAEFVEAGRRLAVIESEDNEDDGQDTGIRTTEGRYTLDDGRTVELRFSTDESTLPFAQIRITELPVESLGADMQIRRVTLARSIEYSDTLARREPDQSEETRRSFDEAFGANETDDAQMRQLHGQAMQEDEEDRLADRLTPRYRPAELVKADTSALVECKLPNSRLFRTERYDRIDSQEQRTAHLAARRHAGEPMEYQPYSIAEHQGLMALLSSIDPGLNPPEPLDSDFDITWRDPPATPRSWTP